MWIIAGSSALLTLGTTAAIGGTAAYLSAKEQSKAAREAAKAARESGDAAAAAQLEMFYKTIELDKPFREQALQIGKMGIEARRGLKNIAEDLYKRATVPTSDPIYQYQKKQLERELAKRGLQKSGFAMENIGGIAAQEAMRREKLLGVRRGIYSLLAGGKAGQSAIAPYAMKVGANLADIKLSTGRSLQEAAYNRGSARSELWENLGNIAQTGFSTYARKKRWI